MPVARTISRMLDCTPIVSTVTGASEIIYKLARKTNTLNPVNNGWRSDLKLHVVSKSYRSCALTMIPFAGNITRLVYFCWKFLTSQSTHKGVIAAAVRDKDFSLLEELATRVPMDELTRRDKERIARAIYSFNDGTIFQKVLAKNHPFRVLFLDFTRSHLFYDIGGTFSSMIPPQLEKLLRDAQKKWVLREYDTYSLAPEKLCEISKQTLRDLVESLLLFPEDEKLIAFATVILPKHEESFGHFCNFAETKLRISNNKFSLSTKFWESLLENLPSEAGNDENPEFPCLSSFSIQTRFLINNLFHNAYDPIIRFSLSGMQMLIKKIKEDPIASEEDKSTAFALLSQRIRWHPRLIQASQDYPLVQKIFFEQLCTNLLDDIRFQLDSLRNLHVILQVLIENKYLLEEPTRLEFIKVLHRRSEKRLKESGLEGLLGALENFYLKKNAYNI